MKKTVWFALVCACLMLFAMVFDYWYNQRSHRVEFHTVSLTDIQNQMEFSSPVEYRDGLYLMTPFRRVELMTKILREIK